MKSLAAKSACAAASQRAGSPHPSVSAGPAARSRDRWPSVPSPRSAVRGGRDRGRVIADAPPPGQDGVGVAEDATIGPDHDDVSAPRAGQFARCPRIGGRGKRERPYRAEHGRLRLRQRAQDDGAPRERGDRRGQVGSRQGGHGTATAPAERRDEPVLRHQRLGLAQALFHVRELLPHPVGLGEEEQRLRPGVGHVEPLGGGERETGVPGRLAEVEPEVTRRPRAAGQARRRWRTRRSRRRYDGPA